MKTSSIQVAPSCAKVAPKLCPSCVKVMPNCATSRKSPAKSRTTLQDSFGMIAAGMVDSATIHVATVPASRCGTSAKLPGTMISRKQTQANGWGSWKADFHPALEIQTFSQTSRSRLRTSIRSTAETSHRSPRKRTHTATSAIKSMKTSNWLTR